MGERSIRPGRQFTGARRVGAVAAVSVLTAVTFAGPALASADGMVEGTPCTGSARACVDLGANKAWLIHDGTVGYGPVSISHGAAGEETPTGTFAVQWKDEHHHSAEFDDAAMPYSVFFAPGGIAFHEGNPSNASAGCVHLAHDDAVAFYHDLEVGDEVQVH